MINKLITSDSYDFGDMATRLVPLHRGGVDSQWMRKHASADIFAKELASLKPTPGRTILHIIALGDEERYGANRNCDAFARDDNIKAHHLFKDIGKVYRNHKNDDPSNNFGDVLATAHNDQMSRVELLVSLINKLCPDEVEAVNSGKDVPFSMGSSQEYDVCSLCQHKAPTSQDHCFHIKNALGEILRDGTKIYMKNPNPRFFDISIVYKPADRIAYSLRKVAGTVVGGHDLAEMYGLTPAKLTKRATMQALAEIMKEIPAVARKVAVPRSVCADTKQELSKLAKAYGISQLIGCLTKRGFLLSPEDFAEVTTGQKVAAVDDVCGCGLNDIIDDRQEIEAFDPPIAQDNIPLSASAVNDLETNCSMSEGPMRKRVMIIIMKPQPKVASVGDPTEIHGLSMLYKHYKVAFAHAHRSNPALVRAVASTF